MDAGRECSAAIEAVRRRGIQLVMNHRKLRRLYLEERLQVRRRLGRKRAPGTRAPIALP
jgi:putative transposase